MKRHATKWHTPKFSMPTKFRREQGKQKLLLIFFYDICGVLTSHRVETGQTVNDMYYKGCIQQALRPAIQA